MCIRDRNYKSVEIIANSIGAFFAMNSLSEKKIAVSYTHLINSGASEKEIYELVTTAKEKWNMEIPQQYLDVLSRINGIEFNGFILYGVDQYLLEHEIDVYKRQTYHCVPGLNSKLQKVELEKLLEGEVFEKISKKDSNITNCDIKLSEHWICAKGKLIAKNLLITVSYTHLDVYKRQALELSYKFEPMENQSGICFTLFLS